MIRGFNDQLNRTQGTRIFEDVRRHFGLEGVVVKEDDLNKLPRPSSVSDVSIRFDRNRYIHLVLVHDDMRDVLKDGLSTSRPADTAVADHIRDVSSILARRPDFVTGFTLVIMLGVGRHYEVAIPGSLPSDWFLQAWSLFDFERLCWLENKWERMLWKLSKQRDTLSKRNLDFVSPDDATLYASWMNQDYRLIPKEATDSGHLLVSVSCGEVFTLREMARLQLDTHTAYRPDLQSWAAICRVNPVSYFKDDRLSSRYGAPEMVARGVLAGAVVTKERTWWIDCDGSLYPDADRTHIFQTWEAANVWLARVLPVAERQLRWPAEKNPIVTLDVSGVVGIEDWSLAAMENAAPVKAFETAINRYGFTIKVPLAFVTMGRQPENRAETLLAKAFVSGAAMLGGHPLSHVEIESEFSTLHISRDERHMHMLLAIDHRDYLREFGQSGFHLLEDADVHFADAEIAYEAGLSGPSLIEDRKDGNERLKLIVDAFWERCKRRLQLLNRRFLVLRCLRNNEAVIAEQENWTRTRRAVAAVHKDGSDVFSASLSARQIMDRTQIAHRLLIEMAICTCPEEGGRDTNQEDIDFLGAQVLQLAATAQEADAMRAGAIPPWVRIGSAGDVRLASDFSELMKPYLASHFELTHKRDVADYERHLEEPKRGTKTESEAFGDVFLKAFLEEYGISPMRLVDVATVLAEDAHERRTNVVIRSTESLRELLKEKGYAEEEVDGFFQHFVLPARPDWTEVQPPFRSKDWWPWRFRRHLSVMNRPIVALSDSELAYAPGFCEDSFRHVITEAFTGATETEYFVSQSMRKYIGSENARLGLEFNKAVAERFRDAGWNTWTEIEMSHLQCPKDQAAGDVDVIAEKAGVVFVCECKDLSFARTITEVVEQLGRFRGREGDDLYKHLRRVKWIRDNGSQLRHVVGRQPVQIRSLLISSKIVPMQHAEGFPEEVVSIDELGRTLAT